MNFLMGLFGKVGAGLVSWAIGGIVRSFVEEELRKQVDSLKDSVIDKINSDVKKVDDEDLKNIAKSAVRYVAKNFPDIDNSEKLKKAISTFQAMTPPAVDFFISDAAMRGIIEAAYSDFKKDLSTLE